MEESFNPYLKWLGIPLADQPPNHYRLLGIPELMDDADVISNSADRQMGHVRNFASGKHSHLSQKLLNEIAAAKVCLLTPAKKEAYDQHLRSLINPPSSTPVPKTRPLPQAQPVMQTRPLPQATTLAGSPSVPVLEPAAGNSVTRRVKKKSSAGLLIAGVLGLLLVSGVVVWNLNRPPSETSEGNNPTDSPVAVASPTDQDDTSKGPATEPNPAQDNKTPTTDAAEQVPVATGSQGEETRASEPESSADATVANASVEETSNTDSTSQSDNSSGNSPAKKKTPPSVNLLEQIDITRDAVQGNWTLDGKALISPPGQQFAKFMLPAEVPKEYLLEMEVERVAGDNILFVGLIIAGKQREFFVDWHADGSRISGFAPSEIFPPHRGVIFQNGRPRHLQFHVTDGRVVVNVDGKTLFDLQERLEETSNPPYWAIPNQKVLYLGSHQSSYRFTKVELTPLEAGDPNSVAQSDNSPAQNKTSPGVDLLKQIDVDRDRVQGDWKLESNVLVSPESAELAKFMLPGEQVPKEYVLEMEVERVAGEKLLFIGLMIGGKQVELFIDYNGQNGSDYSSFVPEDSFPRHQGPLLQLEQPSLIRCQVTENRVKVSVDDETVFDLTERLDELDLARPWAIPNKKVLYLGSHYTSFRFTKLKLTPLDENASTPNQETSKSQPPVVEKLPLPVGPELEAAQKNLSEIFKEDLAEAKSAEQKRALAETLLNHATDDSQKPVEKFVLLRAARSLAISGADPATAMKAIDEMAEHFQVKPLEQKAEALTELSQSAETTEDQTALITATGEVVRLMVEAEQFDQAAPLIKLAQNAAIKTRNADLRRKLAAGAKEFEELHETYRKIQPDLEKLQEVPDDPAANLAVGRYRAFVQFNWPAGLKHLAAGGDETLRDLAAKDLAGTEDSAQQVELAEAWWEAAAAEASDLQAGPKIRAGFWYKQALPSLTGLTREKVLKRLEEIRELDSSGRIQPEDWELWVSNGQRGFHDTREAKIFFDGGVLSMANNLNRPILLVYHPFVSDGPCLATMEIKGPFHQMGLINVEQLSPSIVASGTTDQQWHTVTLGRLADKSVIVMIDGKRVEVRHWRSNNDLVGKIAFWLQPKQACSIRRFEVRTTPSQ